jgi:hypothetical protein
MFELTKVEWQELITICDNLPQTVKFRSQKAIDVNISIMRTFVALCQYALGYAELNRKLEDFMITTNVQFSDIYQALTELAEQNTIKESSRKQIG